MRYSIYLTLTFIVLTATGCTNTGGEPGTKKAMKPQDVHVRFWLSHRPLGPILTAFNQVDTIHFNYVIENPSSDSLGWCMGDGGPFIRFVIQSGNDTLKTSMDGFVMPRISKPPCGTIAPHDSLVTTWKAPFSAGQLLVLNVPSHDSTATTAGNNTSSQNTDTTGKSIDTSSKPTPGSYTAFGSPRMLLADTTRLPDQRVDFRVE